MKRLNRALAAGLVSCASPSLAAADPTIEVDEIAATPECRILESCWGWWMMVVCRNNFAPLRLRLQSAFHESGRFTAAGRGAADLSVTGRVTQMGLVTSSAAGRDYQLSSNRAVATLDLAVAERGGRILFAGTVSANVDAGTAISTDGLSFEEEANARAVYAELQSELALAASRAAAFAVDPLRVVEVNGRAVQLNYGAPLMALDQHVEVLDASGRPVHLRVVGVTSNGAVAESAGDTSIEVSAPARMIEAGIRV
jgi:hypothetical protein